MPGGPAINFNTDRSRSCFRRGRRAQYELHGSGRQGCGDDGAGGERLHEGDLPRIACTLAPLEGPARPEVIVAGTRTEVDVAAVEPEIGPPYQPLDIPPRRIEYAAVNRQHVEPIEVRLRKAPWGAGLCMPNTRVRG